ncbi:MAG: PilN domain-containing protein [Methylophilaceae bacterium]
MRALRLDFSEDKRWQYLIGVALLALALALGAIVFWYYISLNNEKMQLESIVEKAESKLNQERLPAIGNVTANTKDVIVYYNKVIQKLNLPWDNLFVILEKAKGENIALLGVEPNAKDAKVKLTGEAKDFKAMFDYVRALREQPVLSNVYLLDHKIDDQNPDKPIRFTLEAAWVEKP